MNYNAKIVNPRVLRKPDSASERSALKRIDEASGGGIDNLHAKRFGITPYAEIGLESHMETVHYVVQTDVFVNGCHAVVLRFIVRIKMRLHAYNRVVLGHLKRL